MSVDAQLQRPSPKAVRGPNGRFVSRALATEKRNREGDDESMEHDTLCHTSRRGAGGSEAGDIVVKSENESLSGTVEYPFKRKSHQHPEAAESNVSGEESSTPRRTRSQSSDRQTGVIARRLSESPRRLRSPGIWTRPVHKRKRATGSESDLSSLPGNGGGARERQLSEPSESGEQANESEPSFQPERRSASGYTKKRRSVKARHVKSCGMCPQQFSNLGKLIAHLQQAHADELSESDNTGSSGSETGRGQTVDDALPALNHSQHFPYADETDATLEVVFRVNSDSHGNCVMECLPDPAESDSPRRERHPLENGYENVNEYENFSSDSDNEDGGGELGRRPHRSPDDENSPDTTPKKRSYKSFQLADGRFKCPNCTCTYCNAKGLYRHLRNAHVGDCPYSCTICNMDFKYHDVYATHMTVAHPLDALTAAMPDVQVIVQADHNEASGRTPAFSVGRPLPPPPPPHNPYKVAATPAQAHGQEFVRSNDGLFHCAECPKTFTTKRNLADHVVVHSDDRPYICGVCGITYRHRASLCIHMRTHKVKAPHQRFRYTSTAPLKQHGSAGGAGIVRSAQTVANFATIGNAHTSRGAAGDSRAAQVATAAPASSRPAAKTNLNPAQARRNTYPSKAAAPAQQSGSSGSGKRVPAFVKTADGRYNCKFCPKVFDNHRYMARHIVVHTGDKPFKCKMCDAAYPYEESLRRHYINQHGAAKPARCDLCRELFLSQPIALAHQKSCTKKRLKTEDVLAAGVSADTPVSTGTQPHRTASGAFPAGTSRAAATKPKGRNTPSSNVLSPAGRHLVQGSGGSGADASSPYPQARSAAHSDVDYVRSPDGRFHCLKCDKNFSNRKNLVYHDMGHTGVRPFKCSVCNKGYRMKRQVEQHMVVHTGERPYMCNECGLRYRYPKSLQAHRKNCGGPRAAVSRTGTSSSVATPEPPSDVAPPGLIEVVPSSPSPTGSDMPSSDDAATSPLLTPTNRDAPMAATTPRSSEASQKYQCKYCGLRYTLECNLKHHEKLHEKPDFYQCRYCRQGFRNAREHQQHEAEHDDVHQCRACNATFADLSELRAHWDHLHR